MEKEEEGRGRQAVEEVGGKGEGEGERKGEGEGEKPSNEGDSTVEAGADTPAEQTPEQTDETI